MSKSEGVERACVCLYVYVSICMYMRVCVRGWNRKVCVALLFLDVEGKEMA